MNEMPQLVPVSSLRYKHVEIFRKLEKGPVLLAQRSKPAAVLVSVEQWDATAAELQRLKRIVTADQHFAAMRSGDYVTQEELNTILDT